MIIHYITGGDIYSYNYINFIGKYFDASKNKFFVYKSKNYKEQYTTDYPNIEYFNSQIKFSIKKFWDIFNAEKIILHQFNKPMVVLFWIFFHPFIYKKLIWVIWGSDLYDCFESRQSIKEKAIEVIRRFFIHRIRYIACYVEGDYLLCKQVYGTKAKYFKSCYPYTIDENVLKLVNYDRTNINTKVILIGNSADPGNNHLDILNRLAKFKDNDLKLLLILAYGGTKDYVEQIVSHAKSIFGDKVEALTSYLGFEEYMKLLNKTDICIFNHNRQQGLGTANLMLAIKKKVYLKSAITPFKYYNDLGIKVYDTDSIISSSYDDLIFSTEAELEKNRALIIEDTDIDRTINYWKTIIEKKWD